MIVPCPICRAIADWQPWKIRGRLCISFECNCGHSWQVNGIEAMMPPTGRPPYERAPLAPVDYDPN